MFDRTVDKTLEWVYRNGNAVLIVLVAAGLIGGWNLSLNVGVNTNKIENVSERLSRMQAALPGTQFQVAEDMILGPVGDIVLVTEAWGLSNTGPRHVVHVISDGKVKSWLLKANASDDTAPVFTALGELGAYGGKVVSMDDMEAAAQILKIKGAVVPDFVDMKYSVVFHPTAGIKAYSKVPGEYLGGKTIGSMENWAEAVTKISGASAYFKGKGVGKGIKAVQ